MTNNKKNKVDCQLCRSIFPVGYLNSNKDECRLPQHYGHSFTIIMFYFFFFQANANQNDYVNANQNANANQNGKCMKKIQSKL
jgi:hypothetical protein